MSARKLSVTSSSELSLVGLSSESRPWSLSCAAAAAGAVLLLLLRCGPTCAAAAAAVLALVAADKARGECYNYLFDGFKHEKPEDFIAFAAVTILDQFGLT